MTEAGGRSQATLAAQTPPALSLRKILILRRQGLAATLPPYHPMHRNDWGGSRMGPAQAGPGRRAHGRYTLGRNQMMPGGADWPRRPRPARCRERAGGGRAGCPVSCARESCRLGAAGGKKRVTNWRQGAAVVSRPPGHPSRRRVDEETRACACGPSLADLPFTCWEGKSRRRAALTRGGPRRGRAERES